MISKFTKKWLHTQGYQHLTDEKLEAHALGIRTAYLVCGGLVLIGLALRSIPVLGLALAIAFFGAVLKRHPVDYLYNTFLRHFFHKPILPHRSRQNRFACMIATPWIAGIIALLFFGFDTWAFLLGGVLLLQAFAVGTIDVCMLSVIYNKFILKKKKKNQDA